jgi:hypothetical protein
MENKLNIKLLDGLSVLLSFVRASEKMGTNAQLKAPSANMLRKKFGILNAAKKASEIRPAPKNFAIKISLAKPNILEIKVKTPTMKADLKICIKIALH